MASKTLVAIALGLTAALGVGANAAFAGEVTGNGSSLKEDDGTLHGASLCAFSGLNDGWFEGDPERTQSWGQIPREERDDHPSPGQACNPTNF